MSHSAAADDGAQTNEEAYKMIQIAYENGTRNLIATPHYGTHRARASKGTIVMQYLELQEWTKANYPNMNLYLGQELFYGYGLEKRLQSGKALTLAGSRYVLVEFNPDDPFSRIRQGLGNLQMSGYWPIIAHIERYQNIVENTGYVDELLHMGIYIQVNARSITGDNG